MQFLPKLQELLTGGGKTPSGTNTNDRHGTDGLRPLPDDALVLVPMRNAVLFPGLASPVTVGRAGSVAAAQFAAKNARPVGFLMQKDPERVDVGADDLHWVGTAGRIVRHMGANEGPHHLIVQGETRFRVLQFLEGWPFLVARVAYVEPAEETGPEIEARFLQLKSRAVEAIDLLPNAPEEWKGVVQSLTSPGVLADTVANLIDARMDEKQDLLETFDLRRRLDKVLSLLGARVEVLRLSKEIGDKTRQEFDDRQREHVLREQMRQIRKELGEDEDGPAELEAMREAIDKAGMPEETLAQARKELKRLERMNEARASTRCCAPGSNGSPNCRGSSMRRRRSTSREARTTLDADHFGLDKIKRASSSTSPCAS
jgi:ATP-dependent Lon protease